MKNILFFVMIFLLTFSTLPIVRNAAGLLISSWCWLNEPPYAEQLQLIYAHVDIADMPDLDDNGIIFGDELNIDIHSFVMVNVTMQAVPGSFVNMTMRLLNFRTCAISFESPNITVAVTPNEYKSYVIHEEHFYNYSGGTPVGLELPILMNFNETVVVKEHMKVSEDCPEAVTANLLLGFVGSTIQSDFEISVSPSEQTIGKDDHTDYQVTIISRNGFNSLISFEASTAPESDLNFIFYPSEVTLPSDGTAQSLLIVSSTSSTTATTYLVTITASGVGKTHSKDVLLTITTAIIPTELTITKLMVTTPDGERVVSNAIKPDISSDITVQGYLKIRDTNLGVPNAPIVLEIGDLLSATATTGLGGLFSYTFEDVVLPAGSYVLLASFIVDSTFKGSRDARTIVSSPDARGYIVYVEVHPWGHPTAGHVAIYNENGELLDRKDSPGAWPFYTQFLVWGAPPDGWYKLEANVAYPPTSGGKPVVASASKTVWIDRDEVNVKLHPKLPRPYKVVEVRSPANLFIRDPLGRSIGIDPNTGEYVNEIPDAIYLGLDAEPKLAIMTNPLSGTYDIVLQGIAIGDYTLIIEYAASEQATTQIFNGTISPQEKHYYSALISETGEMTAISWEHVFKDPKRGTMLKISTDDRYFQFVAPDKDFGVKYDANMKVFNHVIIICYQDSEMRLVATAIDDDFDFCSAVAWDKQTGKIYWLIDKPYWPRCYCRHFII